MLQGKALYHRGEGSISFSKSREAGSSHEGPFLGPELCDRTYGQGEVVEKAYLPPVPSSLVGACVCVLCAYLLEVILLSLKHALAPQTPVPSDSPGDMVRTHSETSPDFFLCDRTV